MENIFAILNEKIGLNPASIGETSIERAVQHRIGLRNCINIKEYSELLKYDSNEVLELIEEVVVPETWFFRNKVPFQAFKQHVVNELIPKCNKRKPLRLLSIPCATGEEPYSLAITLLEANVNPQSFRIDAIDVSKKAIDLAKRARYGKNSFRDVAPALLDKYFLKSEKGWQLIEPVRNLVKFKQGNVLNDALSSQPGYYDVVFCRNLLIYFDRKKQKHALLKIYKALKKGAILFVGHAEYSQVSEEHFQHAPYSRSFSFLKRDKPVNTGAPLNARQLPIGMGSGKNTETFNSTSTVPRNRAMKNGNNNTFMGTATRSSLVIAATPFKIASRKTPAVRNSEKGRQHPGIHQAWSLSPAEKLANEGRYEEAKKMCKAFLEHQPQSAHGHYLLGLINNVEGDQKAAESLLKKAIYLDPNHEQALVLSCLIAEQKGDMESVQSFKRRIERVKNRKRSHGV